MLLQLSMTVRALFVVLSTAVGAHLPQSPLQVLVLVLVGVAVLVPLISWLARCLARVRSVASHGPSGVTRAVDTPDFVAPAAPGTPGTALPRAPSRRVRAFA